MSKHKGWVGVDLDGTLAHYEGWKDGAIGAPVPAMVGRVKDLLESGVDVRIVTARAAGKAGKPGEPPSVDRDAVAKIEAWCVEHIGQVLPVQFWKDFAMVELWDDRAVQVMANEGIPVTLHALQALSVAENLYAAAMLSGGHVPFEAWDQLRRALGIPAPEQPPRIIPAKTIPKIVPAKK